MRALRIHLFCIAAILGASFVGTSYADEKKVEDVVKALDELKPPTVDRSKVKDRAYVMEYQKNFQEFSKKQSELAAELFKLDAKHEKLQRLMLQRWNYLMSSGSADDAKAEIASIIKDQPDSKLAIEARFANANIAIRSRNVKEITEAINAFSAAAPKDPRGASLWLSSARSLPKEEQKAIYEKVAAFPESPQTERAIKSAKGKLKQLNGIGKPFEFSFSEALTGTEISNKTLRGKIIVVDFWATWCGPCVAEMPHMKEIYAKYKDKGVEFIGISLDQPGKGLDKLKEFVKKEEIAWPQYYQGNFWQSEFSSSWGIDSIPALFIVDQEGNLHDTAARGKVEQVIENLLKKSGAKS